MSHTKQAKNMSGAQGRTEATRPKAKSMVGIKSLQQGRETRSKVANMYMSRRVNNRDEEQGNTSMAETGISGFHAQRTPE